MARRPRRNHSPAFKAKVAVAAIKGEKTLIELAQDFAVFREKTGKIRTWGRDFAETESFSLEFQGICCGNRGFLAFREKIPEETASFAQKMQQKRDFCRSFLKSSGDLAKISQKDCETRENAAKIEENQENVAILARNGKSLTPVRHLTSEEIRNRQKNSKNSLHNPQKPRILPTNCNETADETQGNEQVFAINPVNEEKLQLLLRNSRENAGNAAKILSFREG